MIAATTTYDQIANEDLENLGLETCAAGEDLLQDANKEVAEGGADEHSVQRHLRDARAEVVAVLADIVSDPRSQQFLQTGEHTGGEHLRAQRVLLELEEVGLSTIHSPDQCRFDIIGGGGGRCIPEDTQRLYFHRSIAHRRGARGLRPCRRP